MTPAEQAAHIHEEVLAAVILFTRFQESTEAQAQASMILLAQERAERAASQARILAAFFGKLAESANR